MEKEKEIEQFIEKGREAEPKRERPERIEQGEEVIMEETLPESKKEEIDKEITEIEKEDLPGKTERLFQLAENKGLFYAIKVARKTGDGFLIDTFRDRLAENNYYKKFPK